MVYDGDRRQESILFPLWTLHTSQSCLNGHRWHTFTLIPRLFLHFLKIGSHSLARWWGLFYTPNVDQNTKIMTNENQAKKKRCTWINNRMINNSSGSTSKQMKKMLLATETTRKASIKIYGPILDRCQFFDFLFGAVRDIIRLNKACIVLPKFNSNKNSAIRV